MADNTVTVDGVDYDFDSISTEAQLAVSLYQEAQQELLELSRKSDIHRAAMLTLQDKIKELVTDDSPEPVKED